ncbi:MAG: arginase family protein, partial [Desulfovibrio sp.]|nr:arginase family protein [Desulfovibrio sp.]
RSRDQNNDLSNACVMYRAVTDLGLRLAQFAVRDFSPEEAQTRERHEVLHYDALFLARVGLPERPLPEDFPRNVYVTFDVDALDSSLMPATGTPSPGGLNWRETHFILEKCLEGRRVVGMDVVELAPIPGLHHADFTAAKLCHLLMALAEKANTHYPAQET